MSTVANRLKKAHNEIIVACQQFCRNPNEIKLLAVSKHQSKEKIQQALAYGQTAFGENYVQEALEKITALSSTAAEWHFIGQIQSNKTRAIAENFAWVHTVANSKIATRLAKQRPATLPPLNVCIEVNLDAELSKGGIMPDSIMPLAKTIVQLPQLRLRGLMVIPKAENEFEQQRKTFARCQTLLHQTERSLGIPLDTLSMGMSNDFEAAIAEGATIIRLGTAIFGQRT